MNSILRPVASITLPLTLLISCPLLVSCSDDAFDNNAFWETRLPPSQEAIDAPAASPAATMKKPSCKHGHPCENHTGTKNSPVDSDDPLDHAPGMAPPLEIGPARALLVATPRGDLCLLDPVDGALVATEPAHAMDVMGNPSTPGMAVIAEWHEDESGALTNIHVSDTTMSRGSAFELSVDSSLVVYGPNPTLGIAIREGTSLFCGDEGRTVMSTASIWSRPGPGFVDVGLVEMVESDPQLRVIRWENGFREIDRVVVPTPSFSCPSRLVREGHTPLIVGIHDGNLSVQDSTGKVVAQREGAFESGACVHDALWLEQTEEIAVLAGPKATVFVLSMTGHHPDRQHISTEVLYHDPSPRRILAFDAPRQRLWASMLGRVAAFDRSDEQLVPVNVSVGCKAEAFSLVW